MPPEEQQEGPPLAAPTSPNEREAAQLQRDPVAFIAGEPWLMVADVIQSQGASFSASNFRKLAVYATVAETIHVAAGYLEAEGYDRVAARLRACLQPTEDLADAG